MAVSRCVGMPFALVWGPIPFISWLMPFIGHLGICSSSGRTYDFAGPYTVNEDALLFGRPTRYILLSPTAARKGGAATTLQSVAGDGHDPEAPTRRGGAAPGASAAPGGGSGAEGCACRPHGVGGGGGGGEGKDAVAAVPSAAAVHFWDHRLAFSAATYRLMDYNLMTCNCHCFVAHYLNQIGYRGGGWDMVKLAAWMCVAGRYVSPGAALYTWLPWVVLVALGAYFGRLLFLWCYLGVCAPLLLWFLGYTWCCWRDLSFS